MTCVCVGPQEGLGGQPQVGPGMKRVMGIRVRRWEPPEPSTALTLHSGTTGHNPLSFLTESLAATGMLPGRHMTGSGVGLVVAVSSEKSLCMLSLGLAQGKEC